MTIREDELHRIAEDAAEKASRKVMLEMLTVLGIESSDPRSMQSDFRFLRDWRETTEAVKRRSILTIISTLTAGILGLIWYALKQS